ncbi:hypothetical protein BC628DRAFT_1356572 [Trametes gibbosa]|nr:hypothetical protein BC628DRAFT_1356572 [Trametes gibbosa]
MARTYQIRLRSKSLQSAESGDEKINSREKHIAITIFGVTTPAVATVRTLLARYPCTPYVFHPNGAGGLAAAGFFDGTLDLTTALLADELVGGVLSAGPHRLEAAALAGIPQVISLGALDMVKFGPRASVPERYATGGHRLHEHNP